VKSVEKRIISKTCIIEFDVTLWAPEENPNSAALTFPFSAVGVFGTRARVPVKFSVDGHVFRSTLAPMGGCHMMVFNMQMRAETGYKAGDTIHIVMERDTEPRTIELPEDVENLLKADDSAYAVYQKYSYSHKKEIRDWINDAKKPETRARRIQLLLEKLSAKSIVK
jgi:hypothetical protein